jgi:hypothetical protein
MDTSEPPYDFGVENLPPAPDPYADWRVDVIKTTQDMMLDDIFPPDENARLILRGIVENLPGSPTDAADALVLLAVRIGSTFIADRRKKAWEEREKGKRS